MWNLAIIATKKLADATLQMFNIDDLFLFRYIFQLLSLRDYLLSGLRFWRDAVTRVAVVETTFAFKVRLSGEFGPSRLVICRDVE